MQVTMTKTQNAQVTGIYKLTSLDAKKSAADFRIMQMSPAVIIWKDGKQETVTDRKLHKLMGQFNGMCDF